MVQILGLDVAGNPAQWLTAEQAITLAATDGIAWQWGEGSLVFHGGWNRHGERSVIELSPIVALAGRKPNVWLRMELPLTNLWDSPRQGGLVVNDDDHVKRR